MNRLSRWVLAVVWVLGSVTVAQAYQPLKERMSAAEFKAAELDKLSPAALAALDAWLAREAGETTSSAAPTAPGAPAAAPVAAKDVAVPEGYALVRAGPGFDATPAGSKREDILSSIEGPFNGWRGHTRFVLANGQVWQQTDTSVARLKERRGVAIRISPRLMGGWRLKAEGIGDLVPVKRIK